MSIEELHEAALRDLDFQFSQLRSLLARDPRTNYRESASDLRDKLDSVKSAAERCRNVQDIIRTLGMPDSEKRKIELLIKPCLNCGGFGHYTEYCPFHE